MLLCVFFLFRFLRICCRVMDLLAFCSICDMQSIPYAIHEFYQPTE